jgi:ABC-type sugar transport system substrate-binding protein
MSGASNAAVGDWRRRASYAWLLLALLACILAPTPAAAQQQAQPLRIMLVYGVSPDLAIR